MLLHPCNSFWGGIELSVGVSNGTIKPVGGRLDMSYSEIDKANLRACTLLNWCIFYLT